MVRAWAQRIGPQAKEHVMGGSHSGSRHRHVFANVPMRLAVGSGDVPVSAELHYSTRDPFAVRATFCRTGYSPVAWTFARDLLLVGVARPAGLGDVQVFPDKSAVILHLSSPEGTARLAAQATELRQFVARMLSLVPAGGESAFYDLDAELAAFNPVIPTGGNG
jgi:hypothetical protein